MLCNLDLQPSLADDPGWDGEFDSHRTPTKRMRASVRPCPPDTTDAFDDTFTLHRARLREGNDSRFERGVPTNGKTSSQNYDDDLVKIIDGEHKSLLTLGKINEAMEEDDHQGHIFKHRLQLADPNLTETQRAGLMEHLADHVKKQRKKLKAVTEALDDKARPDISRHHGYRSGVGMLSHAKPAHTYDVIPQDPQVDLERKRTAGNMSMEAGRATHEARMRKFDKAVSRAYGTRRGL